MVAKYFGIRIDIIPLLLKCKQDVVMIGVIVRHLLKKTYSVQDETSDFVRNQNINWNHNILFVVELRKIYLYTYQVLLHFYSYLSLSWLHALFLTFSLLSFFSFLFPAIVLRWSFLSFSVLSFFSQTLQQYRMLPFTENKSLTVGKWMSSCGQILTSC